MKKVVVREVMKEGGLGIDSSTKLVNGTGKMHLKTALKGFLSQMIEAVGDEAIEEGYDWGKNSFLQCVEGD